MIFTYNKAALKKLAALIFLVTGMGSYTPAIVATKHSVSTQAKKDGAEKKKKKAQKRKKLIKATPALALGFAATANCILSATSLVILFKNLRKINQSYISNPTFRITKFFLKYCSNLPDIDKYVIPGITFSLATSAVCSFYAACNMLKKAYRILRKK